MLSPVLFILFVDDLLFALNEKYDALMYADDLVVIVSHVKFINEVVIKSVNSTQYWSEKI